MVNIRIWGKAYEAKGPLIRKDNVKVAINLIYLSSST